MYALFRGYEQRTAPIKNVGDVGRCSGVSGRPKRPGIVAWVVEVIMVGDGERRSRRSRRSKMVAACMVMFNSEGKMALLGRS
ncbi:hypothetical protein HPB47_004686 [Ixodes persulcatus]|uniref:Uncharacterized protein n=1 Tax=Ixodes persulcatus TaxID=34615 RepID=A0AC60PF91_IXOPE|nr:hypothetical protein HPB47_004686 [Ixodes persulcatus]